VCCQAPRGSRRWETGQEAPANTQPFPWVRCWATRTMSLLPYEAGKSHLLVLVSYPMAPGAGSCQNGLLHTARSCRSGLLHPPTLDAVQPCQRPEGLWLPVLPVCRQWGGLQIYIAYFDSCLICISSCRRTHAPAHAASVGVRARGAWRGGRRRRSAATCSSSRRVPAHVPRGYTRGFSCASWPVLQGLPGSASMPAAE